jgi:hypothetical protein
MLFRAQKNHFYEVRIGNPLCKVVDPVPAGPEIIYMFGSGFLIKCRIRIRIQVIFSPPINRKIALNIFRFI